MPKKMLNQKLKCKKYTCQTETEANRYSWMTILYLLKQFEKKNPDKKHYCLVLNRLYNSVLQEQKGYENVIKKSNKIEQKIDKHMKKHYDIEFSH